MRTARRRLDRVAHRRGVGAERRPRRILARCRSSTSTPTCSRAAGSSSCARTASRTASRSGRTGATRSTAAPTPVVFPQPGHFDYDLRIAAMDAAGIDVSIVSLTCPNVYWGGEDVSSEAARESNASMAEAQRDLPGPDPLVRLAAVGVPGARGRGARAALRRGRGRRHGPRQRRRPEPDRARLRADLGGDRPAGAAGPRPPRRAARRRPDGHGLVRPVSWSVGFMFDTTLAIDPDDLRRLPRPVPGPQAHRGPRRRRRSPTSSAGSRRATRSSCPSGAG